MLNNTSLFNRFFALFVFCFLLVGCDQPSSHSSSLKIGQVEKSKSGWPRSIMTREGLLTLDKQPSRIVSTSVTLSGTLLAINAPLVASGATMANTSVAAEQGFMRQWANVAEERGVIPLYQTEPNAEAIIKANPDLIIISATGGDSALKLYDQLKNIAPILVIGYDDKSWIQLADVLGNILGLEEQAKTITQRFEKGLKETKSMITLPPQPTTAMVYYQDGTGANIWTTESAQGRILQELGFTIADIPESVKGNISMGMRNDIVIATGERFPDAVTGHSVLLFSASKDRETAFKENHYLRETSAVKNNQVFAVGDDTFRLDYYSATNLLKQLQTQFGHQTHVQ
ncbi:Fe2+-enterobactin ABC transporter substrate-binding protein [Marinomonas sp. RSW2]|uniref:Fe2+-enterobactin ABC transporter substrate-binding protein n=1 Tax=Marinomonas maritima TaxID=2940935 RepID=A0ABT5WD75_9GAMM|nr:Fe2+-enterobactin ABC transporter substrate-binding protein [Marinomonas maritima]MDE8602772.1 Fe2+-enterobactin ABC transporter substrate-binding protein [Marinomonas maritima]